MTAQAQRTTLDGTLRAAELLREARYHERSGRLTEAMDCCVAAIAEASWSGAWAAQTVGLRRLSVLHHQRGEPAAARETCRTSYEVALAAGDGTLAAEALNTLARFELECGNLTIARAAFEQALALARESEELSGRIAQNLGTLANLQGDLIGALEHYQRSLDIYQGTGTEHECALAYHELGMAAADRGDWDEADRLFHQSRSIAEAQGDVHQLGLCTLPH